VSYKRRVVMQVWYEKYNPRVGVFFYNHLRGRECVRTYHQVTPATVRRITKHFNGKPCGFDTAHERFHQMVRAEWEA